MIKQTDILTAINKLLVKYYPGNTVNIQPEPKDYQRPSFYIDMVRVSQVDKCKASIEKTVYVTITYFSEIDKYYRSDPEDLANTQDAVMQIFNCGFVTIGDRAIKVISSAGGLDLDRAYIDLQFEFIDNRTDEIDQIPVATEVVTRIGDVIK